MTILTALIFSVVHGSPSRVAKPHQKSDTIEVPFRIGETAIIVDAIVNSKKVALMFDTGFSGAVVVDESINLGKPTGKMALRDFVRETEAPTTEIKSLFLGSKKIEAKDLLAVQQPEVGSSVNYNQHCDGIMGYEVIKDEVTEINFEHNKFIFHPKSYDISTKVPDNKRTFLTRLLRKGHAALEMNVVSSTGKKMVLALDTGNSFYATTYRETLEDIGEWTVGQKPKFMGESGVASGNVDSWNIVLKGLQIFGIPVAKSVWDVIDLPSSTADSHGTVGFEFLKNFNITIDFNRRFVWFENFSGKVENEVPGEIGIYVGFEKKSKQAIIYKVAPDSPAAKAGIKDYDKLLSLDGTEVGNVGSRRMRKILEGPIGSKVAVAISRDGEVKRFTLERVALVNEK